MTKARKSNKESKKRPILTMKEKRAAKKSKKETEVLLGNDNVVRSRTPISGIKRS